MENLEIGLFPRMFLKRITSRVLLHLLSCGRRIAEIRLRIKAFNLRSGKGERAENQKDSPCGFHRNGFLTIHKVLLEKN